MTGGRKAIGIDYRTKVGTEAWNNRHTEQQKKLSAWRRLHALLSHEEVKKVANYEMTSTELASIVKEVEAKRPKLGRNKEQ
ncbi:MAG: hypothetical protein ACYSWO_30055 [Planctomycetota bacterium]|jgi:hypothetical protein